ncbi:site-specific integrase [Vibrio parahaemolyticus]|nr:site-specific integrase [Vibrio parahaemolyticus]
MAINKLTDSKLKTMAGKPRKKPTTVADGMGLSARISAVGGISWLFRFSGNDGKAVWITIGKYPEVTLRAAREERDKIRAWLSEGKDPRKEREISRGESFKPKTVSDCFSMWIDNYAKQNRSDINQLSQRIDIWVPSDIANMPVSEATSLHWIEAFSLRSGKYPVAAGSFLQTLKQVMSWCGKRGINVHRSVYDLDLDLVGGRHQKKKSRTLIEEDNWLELVDLVNGLNNGLLSPYYTNLVTLLLIFGARTQEVRRSKISEWNLSTMVWTVPPEHNKNFKKSELRGQKGDIKRPIPDVIKPLIAQLCLLSKNEYLLGELKNSSSVSTWGALIYKKLGHSESWSLHDIRRTVATGMSDLEIDPYIVEAMLGHSLGGVKGIYNRSHYLVQKRKALDVWVGKLIELGFNPNPLSSAA